MAQFASKKNAALTKVMVVISNTNIVVDEFTFGTSVKKYIYFLTHMHGDHYGGLSNTWSGGPIYCSLPSKNLLLSRWPDIKVPVHALELNVPHTIYLNDEKSLSVQVHLFDANHCPGAVMFLFQGYMGTILNTGDIRFTMSWFTDNPILYPPELRTPDFSRCSIHIDELIYDNTYCDPIFKFPTRKEAVEEIVKIINKKRPDGYRFLIGTDSLGKEELLLDLAQIYGVKIVVSMERLSDIFNLGLPDEYFTTSRESSWLEMTRKHEMPERLADPNEKVIAITPTGWANAMTYESPDGRTYTVPYSLHSNFAEIEMFVRSIFPCFLNPVVRHNKGGEKVGRIYGFSSYMINLQHLKQRGHDFFKTQYIDKSTISKEYVKTPEEKERIRVQLGLPHPDDVTRTRGFFDWKGKRDNPPANNMTLDKFSMKRSRTSITCESTDEKEEKSTKITWENHEIKRASTSQEEISPEVKRIMENSEQSSGNLQQIKGKSMLAKFASEELKRTEKIHVMTTNSETKTTSPPTVITNIQTETKTSIVVTNQSNIVSHEQIQKNINAMLSKMQVEPAKPSSIKGLMARFINKDKKQQENKPGGN